MATWVAVLMAMLLTHHVAFAGRFKANRKLTPDNRTPVFVPGHPQVSTVSEEQNRQDWSKLDRSLSLAEMRLNRAMATATNRSSNGQPGEVCMSPNCVRSAAAFLESMDMSVNPCEDFYQFVCGSYIDSQIIPEYSSSKSNLGQINELKSHQLHNILTSPKQLSKMTADEIQMKNFFESCMDSRTLGDLGYQPLWEMLSKLDIPLPMFKRSSYWKARHIEDLLGKSLKFMLGGSALFSLDIGSDPEASMENYVLQVAQPSVRLSPKLYKAKDRTSKAIMEFYGKYYMAHMDEFFGYSQTNRQMSLSRVKQMQIVQKMIRLEASLAGTLQTTMDTKDYVRKVSFGKFKSLLGNRDGGIDFAKVIADFVQEMTGRDLTDSSIIMMPHVKFFRRVNSVLSEYSASDIMNYMVVNVLMEFAPLTTDFMRSINTELNSIFSGITTPAPRWMGCVSRVIDYFGARMSQLFIEHQNGEEIRNSTQVMIEDLRDAFRDGIKSANWMDEETREKAMRKLNSIKAVDLFLDPLDTEEVARVYENLEGIGKDTYLANTVTLQQFWTKKSMDVLFQKPKIMGDFHRMDFDATLVNAMYVPDSNSINIPLGIQAFPIFQNNRIEALNYGGIGTVLGHELTHGFDNNGALFDYQGNFKNWWSQSTFEEFERKQKCFIEQYNGYIYPYLSSLSDYDGPKGVNGKQTLGENIADNGGLREAFNAYKKRLASRGLTKEPSLPGLDFNSDQLFFMSTARTWCEVKTVTGLVSQLVNDPHSPAQVRVMATMRNYPEFQKAFHCENTDRMVEQNHCRIW